MRKGPDLTITVPEKGTPWGTPRVKVPVKMNPRDEEGFSTTPSRGVPETVRLEARYSHTAEANCFTVRLFGSARKVSGESPTRSRKVLEKLPKSEEHTSELQSLRHLVCR